MPNRKSYLEGCYHEMGHVLATLLCVPEEDRIKGISFSRQPNGGFKFETNYKKYQWKFPRQVDALIMCCIGGGVFQQMKLLYGVCKGKSEFNSKSQITAQFDLKDYLSQNVKSIIEGMEDDLCYLNEMYTKLLMYKKVSGELNLELEKEKAINLFLPYIECAKIEQLCEHFVDMIYESNGTNDNIMSINEINKYLMDEGCEYYKYYQKQKNDYRIMNMKLK